MHIHTFSILGMTSLQKLTIGDGNLLDEEIFAKITSLIMLEEMQVDASWVNNNMLVNIACFYACLEG